MLTPERARAIAAELERHADALEADALHNELVIRRDPWATYEDLLLVDGYLGDVSMVANRRRWPQEPIAQVMRLATLIEHLGGARQFPGGLQLQQARTLIKGWANDVRGPAGDAGPG